MTMTASTALTEPRLRPRERESPPIYNPVSDDSDVPLHTDISSRHTYRVILNTTPKILSDTLSFLAESAERASIRLAYELRIDELRTYAAEEGFTISQASEADFWKFMKSAGFTRRAGLVAMDNGDLRAVWDGDGEDHLGLHFLGGGSITFVIFKQQAGRQVQRLAGTDTLDGMKERIHKFDLTPLVNR